MTTTISSRWVIILVIITIWDLYWRGRALWRSAGRHDAGWFIALLIINTAGLLPIGYLVTHGKQTKGDNYE